MRKKSYVSAYYHKLMPPELKDEIIAHWRPRSYWLRQKPNQVTKIGRNVPCPCGSGKKYKQCCGN